MKCSTVSIHDANTNNLPIKMCGAKIPIGTYFTGTLLGLKGLFMKANDVIILINDPVFTWYDIGKDFLNKQELIVYNYQVVNVQINYANNNS
jgi:hypothetical protein